MSKGVLVFEHGRGARLHGTRAQLRPVYKKLVSLGYTTTHRTAGQGKGRMVLLTAASVKAAKEITFGQRTLFNPAEAVNKPFKVAAVSSNMNSFGLYGMVLVGLDGEAWEVGVSHLLKQRKGSIVWVSKREDRGMAFAGLGYEIPRKLLKAPADVMSKIWA